MASNLTKPSSGRTTDLGFLAEEDSWSHVWLKTAKVRSAELRIYRLEVCGAILPPSNLRLASFWALEGRSRPPCTRTSRFVFKSAPYSPFASEKLPAFAENILRRSRVMFSEESCETSRRSLRPGADIRESKFSGPMKIENRAGVDADPIPWFSSPAGLD